MPKEDSERYRGSYTFTEESLLLGGTFLILSATFNNLESLSELFITVDPPIIAPKRVVNTTYERQISEAIPRNERPNEAPAPRQAQQARQVQQAAQDIPSIGIRKSSRAPKPKERN
jgi:hypothetical protein